MASYPGHSYHGQTYSGLPHYLGRPSILAKSTVTDRVGSPLIVTQIFQMWRFPTVDMFSTGHNTHLLQFMSPIPEPQALAVDALPQPWQGRSMYMFPPFPLHNEVIQKLSNSGRRDHSYNSLVAISTVVPTPDNDFVWINFESYCTIRICCPNHCTSQMEGLSCSTSKQQDFQKRSLDSQHLLEKRDKSLYDDR